MLKYPQPIIVSIILIILSVFLTFLYGINSEVAKFASMCLSGCVIAFVFALASMPIYYLSEGDAVGRFILVIVHLILATSMIYASSTNNGDTIVGTRIDPSRAIIQSFLSGIYLSSTIGLVGILVDFSIREKTTRLLTLSAAIFGHLVTIALYSSLSILPVIVSSLVARDLLSGTLHRIIQKKETRTITRVNIIVIFVNILLLSWISFLALS